MSSSPIVVVSAAGYSGQAGCFVQVTVKLGFTVV